DFEARSKTIENYGEDKIPDEMFLQDWGITYDELEEYYDQFEKMAGTSGEEDPVGVWRSSDYPTPPMKETPPITLFKEAAKNLGYHPFQIPSGNISEQYLMMRLKIYLIFQLISVLVTYLKYMIFLIDKLVMLVNIFLSVCYMGVTLVSNPSDSLRRYLRLK